MYEVFLTKLTGAYPGRFDRYTHDVVGIIASTSAHVHEV